MDPALVSYYFGSKSGLFVESLRLPVNPADAIDALLAEGTDDLGARLVTRFLKVWDNPVTGNPLISVLRSASSQPEVLRGSSSVRSFRASPVRSKNPTQS